MTFNFAYLSQKINEAKRSLPCLICFIGMSVRLHPPSHNACQCHYRGQDMLSGWLWTVTLAPGSLQGSGKASGLPGCTGSLGKSVYISTLDVFTMVLQFLTIVLVYTVLLRLPNIPLIEEFYHIWLDLESFTVYIGWSC